MATVIHAILGYFILTAIVRLLTRRPGAQMTLFEFVLVFLIGGIIIISTVGNDRSVTNCTCAVITVGLMHRLVSWLKLRYPRFGIVFDGTPLVLVRQGNIQRHVLDGMHLDPEDVMASARTKGMRGFDEIDYAILERNGAISVMQKEDAAGGN